MKRTLSRKTFNNHLKIGFSLFAVGGMLLGCASSGLVNMWADSTYKMGPMTNMLVIAVKNDPVKRRMWEDGFARELEQRGAKATPSYQLFPDAVPDTQQVIGAIQKNGYDGVLVTVKLSVDSIKNYVPGYSSSVPVAYRNPWTGRYYMHYERVRHPGYTETETVVRYQTDVYTTRVGGLLIWSATSESINPTSSKAVNREITRMIVPELGKQGIVPSKK